MARSVELLLTEDGWQKMKAELSALEDRYVSLASDLEGRMETTRPGEQIRGLLGEMELLDRRISELRDVLTRSMVVGSADRSAESVGIGSTVTVCWEDGEEETYVIVGPPEVDLPAGRISYESPVGRALMGQGQGKRVDALTPGGSKSLLVLTVA